MDRLMRVAQVCLPVLKWVRVLGLLANFATRYLWWGEYVFDRPADRREEAMRFLGYVCLYTAIGGFTIQAIPGGRTANMIARGIAVICLFTALLLSFSPEGLITSVLGWTLAAPILIGAVGAIAYVFSARPYVLSWPFGGKR